MKIGKYKINSSVIIASTLALVGAAADLLSSGWVVESIAQMILYFLQQPESFRPYLTERIYQALLTFLPILSIFLRLYRVRGRPPIEKIENRE